MNVTWQAPMAARQPQKQKNDSMGIIKALFIFIAVTMLISWIIPWIALFM